ncbi:MAG: TonB-dependent receptor [Acidobacteria bacterium]|nr:TonB-dependent receptor [Acidobacteriota bacterium]
MRRFAAFTIFLFAAVLHAQTDLSTIRGTVTDASGAVVPNAGITLTDIERNTSRMTSTGQDGNYEIPFLVPGLYKLTATAAGFKEFVADRIRITSREIRRIDAALELGAVGAQVNVTAEAAVISTEGSQVANGFNNSSFVDSPLSQSFFPQAYMTTLPNIQTDLGGWGLRFAGQSGNQVAESLDGVVSDGPVNLVQNMFDFEELQVVAVNNSAEFPRIANFTMTGRGGSNQFHGRAYLDFVNSALNARSAFAPYKVPYKEHRGNGNINGPIIKDKTFFYFSYSLVRIPSATFFNRNVPTRAMRNGDFSASSTVVRDPLTMTAGNPATGTPFPGNRVPSNRFNPVSLKAQQQYIPEPNQGGANDRTSNFGFLHHWPLDLFRWDSVTGRFDHRFSEKNSIFGRYINRLTPYVLAGSFPNVGTWTRMRHHHSVVLSDTHTFSPRLVNNARWGWIKDDIRDGGTIDGFTPVTGDTVVASLGIQGVNPRNLKAMGFPVMDIVGVSRLAIQPGGTINDRHDFEYTNNTSWSTRSHVIKFGGDARTFRDFRDVIFEGAYGVFNFNGALSGEPYADFLLGLPSSTSRLDPLTQRKLRAYEIGFFFTDTWKVTRRLTLDLGLRWDYFGSTSYGDNLQYNWDRENGDVIIPPGTRDKVSPLYPASQIKLREGQVVPSPARDNFRPRFGAAYRIRDSFVVRGGYGTFSESLGAFHRFQGTGPFQLQESFTNLDEFRAGRPALQFPSPFPARLGSIPSQSVSGYPASTDNGVIHQYNVSIEKDYHRLGLRASYIGSRGRGLNYDLGLNKPRPGLIPFNQNRRPYQQFIGASYALNDGRTNYDALQLEASKRHGSFTFDVHYTLSNSMADYLNLQDPYDHSFWNRDAFNSRHRAVVTTIWDLPFGRGRRYMNTAPKLMNAMLGGWQTQTVHYFQSGQYFSPSFSGTDPSNTNTFGGLPDRIGDGNLDPGARQVSRWFDAGAFVAPAAGRYGNSGVNILEGPGLNLHHLAVVKEFRVTERFKIVPQASMANIFNTPHYAFPQANISVPGQVARIVGHQGGGAPREKSAYREITMRLRVEF